MELTERKKINGLTVKLIRERYRLSLKEFAERIEVTSAFVSDVERNNRIISDKIIEGIYEIFKITEMEIINLNELSEIILEGNLKSMDIFNINNPPKSTIKLSNVNNNNNKIKT